MEQEKNISIKIKRISKMNLSKEVRANNPYQGYDTFFIILSDKDETFQYCVNNNQSRIINQTNEVMAILQSGDEISIMYLPKKINNNNNDSKEVNRIIRIVEVKFKGYP